jgi:hypothetical protein
LFGDTHTYFFSFNCIAPLKNCCSLLSSAIIRVKYDLAAVATEYTMGVLVTSREGCYVGELIVLTSMAIILLPVLKGLLWFGVGLGGNLNHCGPLHIGS